MTMEIDEEPRDEAMEDREKPRDSSRHRSKDRKRDDKDHSRKDRERSKERDEKDHSRKDRERSKERDRTESSRDRRKDDKDRDRSGRDKHRDKERDADRGKDRGKDDRGRDRGKDRDRDREREYDRSKARERDYDRDAEKDVGRDRGKDRERDYDRDAEKDVGRDRGKDREREKEKVRERERDRDKQEREPDRDKSRARDRERESRKGREGEKEVRVKPDGGEESRSVAKKGMEDRDEGDLNVASSNHNEKPISTQSTSELEERLIKMKEERLKKKPDGASEILSWVSKSRKLEEKRNEEKEKVDRLSKALEEQDNIIDESEDEEATDHIAKNLAGVKILHGLDKVIEGGAVVLTLKDQNILADGDINEDADMLENVEIGEQKHRDEAYRLSKKKTGTYDDKFSDDMSSRKTMLPQYDDPVEDEGVTLDQSGRFTGEAEKKLEELRRRIAGGSTGKTFEDLTSSGKVSSDYFSTDEMLQFKKPKKKKSLRKKEKLDLDALEAEAIAAGLGAGDLGSRNDLRRQSAIEEQERADAEMRSNAYLTAYAKAEEASKALREEQTLTIKTVEDDNLVFGEDYEDLQRSLEQARNLALKKQHEAPASGPQAVALMALANREKGDAQSPVGEPQENKVIITEMEEFVLGLQLNEETHKLDSEDVFQDEDDEPKSFEQETKAEVSGWTEVKEPTEDELPVNEDATPDEIIHEVPVGKGLAGAFKLLKERGTLNEGIDWGGRNMDKKKSKLVGIYDSDGGIYYDKDGKKEIHDESTRKETREELARKEARKEIRIERTDEFGRIMTPKEAFRVISHKFHGKGPGKMKQEKRMKQYQEDLKMKQMKASDTPSQAMERMREAQARLKTPYLVLSGHVKPGQTSDPRSGFATVEKDHLGSLTPMLGDKKVEHFLGINRKPDSGSMGPPPPKKPKI